MSFSSVNRTTQTYTNNTQSQTFDYNMSEKNACGLCVQPVYTDTTPVHKGFVAANVSVADNTITITSHGFFTGLKVALTGTNLPAGLSATNYWVVVVDANTIKLATSLANSLVPTVVDITTQGTTADADLAPATLSQVVKLQASIDGTNFSDISGKTVTITAAGNQVWDLQFPTYLIVRTVVTPTSGAMTLVLNFNGVNEY